MKNAVEKARSHTASAKRKRAPTAKKTGTSPKSSSQVSSDDKSLLSPIHNKSLLSTKSCQSGCEHRLQLESHGEVLLLEPVRTRIIEKRKLGSRHILLRVKAHADHDPGQFFQVTVLGFGEAPISIASYSKEHIDLVVNPVGVVTKEVVRKSAGDELLLRGPYGYGYPMHFFFNNNLVLVGGGCGVAPLKGVLDYLAQHRQNFKDVHCFFGYREPKDSIFTKELAAWEKNGTFKFTYAYSELPQGWKGPACNAGYVTTYLEQAGLSPKDTVALICGPTPMMLSTIVSLKKLGFGDDQVWISHERHMKCATGMCGHCMIEGKYTCKDGPVFRWDWIKDAKG
jgi:NAD(P)H-flavin reductase